MSIELKNFFALLLVCGFGLGCNESTKRSTPPSGDALQKPIFKLGDWCQADLKTEEQRTLDALVNSIGATNCAEFEYRYAKLSQKKISIAYENLIDPSPLLALVDLEVLSIRGNKFTNISWTKSFPSLVSLDASENPLGEQSETINLENLSSTLTDLALDRTGIKSVMLQNEPMLRNLSLAGNGIESLSFLVDMVSLVTLHLDQNAISEVSALTQLAKLQILSLSGNPLTSFAPLANLVSLKELNLTEIMLDVDFGKDLLPAQIEKLTVAVTSTSGLQKIDLSEISGLTKLRLLDASGRVIVGNPETESDLTDLILDRTVISDFAILKIFPDLKILDIGNSGLVALPDLSKAQKLTNLLANDNPISSVDGSFLPPSLRVLDLSGCSVSEIKGGSKIPYLSELSLSGNRITSLVDFSWPVGLRILNLSNNALARLADVSELVGLMDLNLSRNQIRNVSSLAILTELLQLDLSHNQVELVAPLAPLAKLTLLDVRANGLPPTTVCPLVNADICLF